MNRKNFKTLSFVLCFILLVNIVNTVFLFVWDTEPFTRVIAGFAFLAILCAFYYGLKGYNKSAAPVYKVYLILLALVIFLGSINAGTVLFSGDRKSKAGIIISMIAFACYFCLIVAENLGKRKSMTLAWTVFVLYAVSIVLSLTRLPGILRGGTITGNIVLFRAGTNFALSLVALVMTKAKYMDKELRGTK